MYGGDRCGEGKRDGDDFVPGSDACRQKSEMEGAGSGVYGNSVADSGLLSLQALQVDPTLT